MADNMDMEFDDVEEEIVELYDEDGNVIRLIPIADTEYNNAMYYAFVTADDDEDGGIVIMKGVVDEPSDDGDDIALYPVLEEDAEYEAVSEIFMQMINEAINIEVVEDADADGEYGE